nr:hypothetical protein [Halorubrum sp. CBA1125]
MTASSSRVGLLTDGNLSDEQRAAAEWLASHDGFAVETVGFDALGSGNSGGPSGSSDPGDTALGGSYPGPGVGDGRETLDRFDALWWHRLAPLAGRDPLGGVATAIDAYLADGGGLLLTLRALASVDRLAVESVPPDRVDEESLAEPTGVLWRSLYADHPALESLDGLRHPLRSRGTVPAVRYERVLPERGEALASTVRGDTEVPGEVTTVSWRHDNGAVLGLGAPVLFGDAPADGDEEAALAETRDRLVAGCLRGVAIRDGTPGRPTDAADLRRLRERVDAAGADGPGGRPKYHLTPPANWLNDPNG